MIDEGESITEAALREINEETGVKSEIIDFIDKIEYWYYAKRHGKQVRFHKLVHCYLFKYKSGNPANHDNEVNEAHWVIIDIVQEMLAFKGEKNIMQV